MRMSFPSSGAYLHSYILLVFSARTHFAFDEGFVFGMFLRATSWAFVVTFFRLTLYRFAKIATLNLESGYSLFGVRNCQASEGKGVWVSAEAAGES